MISLATQARGEQVSRKESKDNNTDSSTYNHYTKVPNAFYLLLREAKSAEEKADKWAVMGYRGKDIYRKEIANVFVRKYDTEANSCYYKASALVESKNG